MSVYIQYGNASYDYGNATRLYGLPTNQKENFIYSNNSIYAQPTQGSPSILMSTVSYGDSAFRTQCLIPTLNNVAGIVIRAQTLSSPTNYYLLTFQGGQANNILYAVSGGTKYIFDTNNEYIIPLNQKFTVEVHAEGTWITVMIENVTVMTVNTNTYTTGGTINYTSGGWGFYAEQAAYFYYAQIPWLFERIGSFTINPGDQLLSAIQNLVEIKSAYIRMNYNNILVVTYPQTSDSSTYTYQNEIFSDSYDQADQSDVNKVVVYGLTNNINAVATNQTSVNGHGMQPRYEIITDQTLTTSTQASTRASRELALVGRYLNQPNIQTTVNVGGELFDVITVVDTDSNLNGTYRVMNMAIHFDASVFDYYQTLGLASL